MWPLEKKTHVKNIKQDHGFTMLEIAIVVLVFGIITIPLLEMYSRYLANERRTTTVVRVEEAVNQLKLYRRQQRTAPCPADRTLSINDANYGIENCAAAAALPASGGCTPNNGICRVLGARTPWASSTPAVAGRDSVLIGAYPFRTVARENGGFLGAEAGQDGWSNKLTYAVTDSATTIFGTHNAEDLAKDFKYGVIRAVDEFENDTAGINNDGLFVVLSHGPNGAGAYSASGNLISACNTSTKEGENCNDDSTFMRAIGDYDGQTSNYYDDYAYFFKDQAGDLWGYMYNPVTSSSTGHIRNLNSRNVGINTGTTTPPNMVTVNGAIRAETSLSNNICNSGSTNCIPTSYFSHQYSSDTNVPTGIEATKAWRNTCPANSVASGIVDGRIQCFSTIKIPPPPGGVAASCPAGTYINSILSNGCVICTDGLTYPSDALCN